MTAQFPDSTKNGWHHVALTVDSDGVGRLYLNGVLVELGGLPPVPSASELRVGTRMYASGSWAGRLDGLRIYRRGLDELDLNEAAMGAASSLTPGLKLYWKMDEQQGTLINPATTSIPVAAGWNRIGYIPNYSLPINETLASLPAQPGDIIKSQYAFSEYLNVTFGWVGNLKYLSPPNRYQIRLAQAGISSTLIGMLSAEDLNVTESGMELGVFAGGEVRGSARALYVEPLDAYLFFLTYYAGAAGEPLHFKLYDHTTGMLHPLSETMVFQPGRHQGSTTAAVPLEWQTTRADILPEGLASFDVSPNPFSSETQLRFQLDKAEEITLTITDAQGLEVVRRPLSAQAGTNTTTWNGRSDTGGWLSSGVYMVRLMTDSGSVSRKVVLRRLP